MVVGVCIAISALFLEDKIVLWIFLMIDWVFEYSQETPMFTPSMTQPEDFAFVFGIGQSVRRKCINALRNYLNNSVIDTFQSKT